MSEYMSKDLFLRSMGLTGDETKYGNRDVEHQSRSYSTYMSYEIMDSVEDSIVEDVAPVRHGRWVEDHDYLRCPNCSVMVKRDFTFFDLGDWNYCPNCGVKMDTEG